MGSNPTPGTVIPSTGDTCSLRRASREDTDAIVRIFQAARAAAMPYLPVLHTDEEDQGFFAGVVEREEVWVAELDADVVAFAALGGGMLDHLYVRPDLRARGIGSALLAKAQELRPNGFRLWVFQRNEAARRFYERHGLELVELTDGSGNEEREPDALYEWRGR